jgi:hypothetical protein
MIPAETGRLSMGFFTPREPAEAGKSAETRGQGKSRELARHDFTPRARRPADPDISGHVGTLVNRVAERSVQEIDELIFKLRQRREQLISETERVQREVIEYAALTQSTMESTKIISESLAQFNKAPDAVRTSDHPIQDVPAAEQRSETAAEPRNKETESAAEPRNDASQALAQHGEDEGPSGDKSEGAPRP